PRSRRSRTPWTSAPRRTWSACSRSTAGTPRRSAVTWRAPATTTTRPAPASGGSGGRRAARSTRLRPSAGWPWGGRRGGERGGVGAGEGAREGRGGRGRGIVLATAHRGKFAEIVEPLIGAPVEIPPHLSPAARAPFCTIPARFAALKEVLLATA